MASIRTIAALAVTAAIVAGCAGDDDAGSPTTSAPSVSASVGTPAARVTTTTAPAPTSTSAPAPEPPATTAPATAPPTTATTPPAPLDPEWDESGAPCAAPPQGGPMFVTRDCVDPALTEPYIDIDEQRTATDPDTGVSVNYRYVHGGFDDGTARFSFYFPAPDQYQGRFFHGTYPTVGTEDTTDANVVFAVSNGAYVVTSNNAGGVSASPALGGYRANAAAAKYSRHLAAQIYGADTPVRGYIYGASGGAYQAIGALENSSGVWDGAVPMVPGTPNAIPNYQAVMLLGLRVLGDQLPAIVDALEPGGSGDPYAGLDDEQRAILEEVTAMGFPPRGWWQHEHLDGGSFWAVGGGVRTIDTTYADDFWSLPGYAGTDSNSSVQAARIQFDTTVAAVSGTSVTLTDTPPGGLVRADLVVTGGAAAGSTAQFATVSGAAVDLGQGGAELAGTLAVGDQVRIDNSWILALQYYHRHQVPPAEQGLHAWDQYRDASGAPRYPQRPMLIGPVMAGVSGGVATGRFEGKMIVLASTLDVEAFPWSAAWYLSQVRAAAGDALDDTVRLWFMDNADHTPPKNTEAMAHIVSYDGELQRALLDLDAWVANGASPASSSRFELTDDSQIALAPTAEERGGVQPVVTLRAAAGEECSSAGEMRVEVAPGEAVAFSMAAAVPPSAGAIVGVDWDFEGAGEFAVESTIETPRAQFETCEVHTFQAPGTYFAVVRVTAQREGDPESPYSLVENLARVRIVVGQR